MILNQSLSNWIISTSRFNNFIFPVWFVDSFLGSYIIILHPFLWYSTTFLYCKHTSSNRSFWLIFHYMQFIHQMIFNCSIHYCPLFKQNLFIIIVYSVISILWVAPLFQYLYITGMWFNSRMMNRCFSCSSK